MMIQCEKTLRDPPYVRACVLARHCSPRYCRDRGTDLLYVLYPLIDLHADLPSVTRSVFSFGFTIPTSLA